MSVNESMEAIIDYRGKTPTKTNSGIPLITAKIVKDGRIEEPSEFISYEDFIPWMRRGQPLPGDVIITTEAPMGEVAQLDDRKIALAQRIICLRGKSTVLSNNYLRYALQSPIVQGELKKRESGTTVTGIKQSELRKALLPIPPLIEQERIADILKSLDDKIELNRKMNATLEKIAQVIYKYWFVDFEFPNPDGKPYRSSGGKMVDSELGEIPEGWQCGTFEKMFNIIMGQSPSGDTYNENGEGIPFYQGRKDFGFRFPTRRVYCTAPQRMANQADALISVRAPVGDLNVATEDCCIGRGLAAVREMNGCASFTYYHLQANHREFEKYESEGTVFGSMSKDGFISIQTVLFPKNVIEGYERIVSPLDAQLLANSKETLMLEGIRNRLLPKLISGKIAV